LIFRLDKGYCDGSMTYLYAYDYKLTISSPGYPNAAYPGNAHCEWQIEAYNIKKHVQIHIDDFDLEYNPVCKDGDHLEFHDGPYDFSPILYTLCGARASLPVTTITATHDFMHIDFVTHHLDNGHNTYKGFKITFWAIDKNVTVMNRDSSLNLYHSYVYTDLLVRVIIGVVAAILALTILYCIYRRYKRGQTSVHDSRGRPYGSAGPADNPGTQIITVNGTMNQHHASMGFPMIPVQPVSAISGIQPLQAGYVPALCPDPSDEMHAKNVQGGPPPYESRDFIGQGHEQRGQGRLPPINSVNVGGVIGSLPPLSVALFPERQVSSEVEPRFGPRSQLSNSVIPNSGTTEIAPAADASVQIQDGRHVSDDKTKRKKNKRREKRERDTDQNTTL
ncbi:unnamed protein product, partial [Owenia fusiformis]